MKTEQAPRKWNRLQKLSIGILTAGMASEVGGTTTDVARAGLLGETGRRVSSIVINGLEHLPQITDQDRAVGVLFATGVALIGLGVGVNAIGARRQNDSRR